MIEQDILAVLLDDAPPGFPTSAGNNVYALMLPQNSGFPAISFQRISSVPVNALSGSSGMEYVRVQFDCWAETFAAAKQLAVELRALLEAGSFKALMANDFDDYDPDAKVYRVSSDFQMWQKEA